MRTLTVDEPRGKKFLYLSPRWRINCADGIQWITQRRSGTRTRRTGATTVVVGQWRDTSFCRTRAALLRCLHQQISDLDASTLQTIESFPDWYPG